MLFHNEIFLENLPLYSEVQQPRSQFGLIKTLNSNGFMLSKPHAYSKLFIDAVKCLEGWVLDIGAAYGVATIPCLKNGGKVIANDIDPRHLCILLKKTPERFQKNLRLLCGQFPDEIELPLNSFSAIHAAGSLHYLQPTVFELSLKKIFNLLKPKGKFYFVTTTPYIELFKEFLPTFIKRKEQNHPWPGLIEDTSIFYNNDDTLVPKLINLLDIEITQNILLKYNFSIERIEYVPYEDAPAAMQGDGRDTIGVVAYKKQIPATYDTIL